MRCRLFFLLTGLIFQPVEEREDTALLVMADQDEIRGNSVYQAEEPVTETPSPVEKPVAAKQEKKSGLMAKLVFPCPILRTPSFCFP